MFVEFPILLVLLTPDPSPKELDPAREALILKSLLVLPHLYCNE